MTKIVTVNGTEVRTGKVKLNFPAVFKATVAQGATEAKYSVQMIIPKGDTETINAMKEAMKCANDQGQGGIFKGKTPKDPYEILHDGDEEKPDRAEYANSYYITASSKGQPDVHMIKGGKYYTSVETTEIYSGCEATVTLNFYPYSVNGKVGIACGLNNVLKTGDGERLAGKPTGVEDFSDLYDGLEDANANDFSDIADDDLM